MIVSGVLSGSVDNWKISPPGADGLRVLLRHRFHNLADVIQIVNYPRGEELVKSHLSEVGVDTAFAQVLWLEPGIQAKEGLHLVLPQSVLEDQGDSRP